MVLIIATDGTTHSVPRRPGKLGATVRAWERKTGLHVRVANHSPRKVAIA